MLMKAQRTVFCHGAGSGRRLRNWIILANIGAWILILLVIRGIFFIF